MNNVEFLGYKPTPSDKYGMLGYATIRMTLKDDKKIILRYKKVKSKGGGEFFCSGSFPDEESGEKKYEKTNELDSRTDDKILIEYIDSKVKSLDSVVVGQAVQQTFDLGNGADEGQVPF